MKTSQDLYDERLTRIRKAIALEKPDRVPVIPVGNAFCAVHLGVKLSDFARDVKLSSETMLQSFTSLGEVDGIQQPLFNPNLLSFQWLSHVKIPGIDFPENVPWQVYETELMNIQDYDTIVSKGFSYFYFDFLKNRLDNLMERIEPILAHTPAAIDRFKQAGIVTLSPIIVTIPYEYFCGGRSMIKFIKDLFTIPDKVEAAMQASMPDLIGSTKQILAQVKPIAVWIGGWRSASEFLSPKMWNRFVWPYFKALINVVIDADVIPVLHFDSSWNRDIATFLELPKAKCIFSTDHQTDIFKLKEILGNHMAIMGDVPAAMFALGSPEEVYDYSMNLINKIGPSGFILSSGCDVPYNAKPENVKAMISAATGK